MPMPAPFVVSHLQLGLLLQSLGAPLSDTANERVGVYLTNALTGWDPSREPKTRLLFPELEAERDAASKVKRDAPILVVLGNPPYNGFAGVAMAEERDLSNAYRATKRAPAPQGQGLNDLYIRFFRMAERRIVEQTGKGVVCFISNYSWLDGLSFTGMRERYLEVFDRVWIDSLNGDKYKTGKLTPEGKPDPSIFSTEFNPEGIQVGTAIALLVRKEQHDGTEKVRFRHLWGRTKRAQLLETAVQDGESLYRTEMPPVELGFPFLPTQVETDYFSWPLLPDLFPTSFPGVKTSRDDVVVDIDRERLLHRMEQYFDPTISHEEMRRIAPSAMESTKRFSAEAVRDYLRRRRFLSQNIIRYCYRPFDVRWLYWEPETKLLDRNRAEYLPHVFDGNVWFGAVQQNRKAFDPPLVSKYVCSLHIIERGANLFPLYLKSDASRRSLFELDDNKGPKSNLSTEAANYLAQLEASEGELFYHTVAMLHSPAYRTENAGAVRQDWPRIPLPASKDALQASAELGRQVAALLDPETPVPGVTTGAIRPELKTIAVVSRVGGGPLDVAAGELALTAGWGHGGKGRAVMPGQGRVVQRPYTPEELAAMDDIRATHASPLQSDTTYDIYLNNVAYWRNVPAPVWRYTIGGYQVIKKWLSYREYSILERPLTADEAREVTAIARRVAAILLLESTLDANYMMVKSSPYAWCNTG
jgi:predicted helicase